jgi:prepilin-type N-terminal cleavage/methylation domain-containing protein/prepilin-type processing-associated H-X9-DG protein
MSRQPSHRAFTLIEVLVVVAIIALLLSILLPSLARARENAKAVVCLCNVRQLAQAFVAYSVSNQNRLPGSRSDYGADWLGGDNPGLKYFGLDYQLNPPNPPKRGRQPDYGTIFKKEMGKMREAYVCPADTNVRNPPVPDCGSFHSYTANLLLAGARTETLVGAHYPKPLNGSNPGYDRDDHSTNMAPFEHVPMIIEESWEYSISVVDDSAWCNDDSMTDRHLREGTKFGYCNIGYADGHGTPFRVPRRFPGAASGSKLTAVDLCIRTGGRWVSGRSWGLVGGWYGYLTKAPDASKLPKPPGPVTH